MLFKFTHCQDIIKHSFVSVCLWVCYHARVWYSFLVPLYTHTAHPPTDRQTLPNPSHLTPQTHKNTQCSWTISLPLMKSQLCSAIYLDLVIFNGAQRLENKTLKGETVHCRASSLIVSLYTVYLYLLVLFWRQQWPVGVTSFYFVYLFCLYMFTISHTAQWQCNDSIAPFQAHRGPFLLITTNILPVLYHKVVSLCVILDSLSSFELASVVATEYMILIDWVKFVQALTHILFTGWTAPQSSLLFIHLWTIAAVWRMSPLCLLCNNRLLVQQEPSARREKRASQLSLNL